MDKEQAEAAYFLAGAGLNPVALETETWLNEMATRWNLTFEEMAEVVKDVIEANLQGEANGTRRIEW
jgi:hypothetical protein